MCRWLGYIGSPILMEELILKPEHSLIDQSLNAKQGAERTNGDGFGIGWYGEKETPGVYKSIIPAWNDRNLSLLSQHIRSNLFLAHIRAATGTPIQETNCHPFYHDQWLFVHNGAIFGFRKIRRELMMEVSPELFNDIEGTTDSELMFILALSFGLKDEPLQALERMAGLIEHLGRKSGEELPIQMTLGMTDGDRLYAVRYSSEGKSRSLYHSAEMEALHQVNPELAERFSLDARAIVSEPLSSMHEAWVEVPESTALAIENGDVFTVPFQPRL